MNLSTAVAALTLSLALGCTASSVNTTAAESGAYAPANQLQADGEVSYTNAGAKSVRDARRRDAYKKMHDHCAGSYQILKEEDQQGAIAIQRRIWFRCLEPAPATTPGANR